MLRQRSSSIVTLAALLALAPLPVAVIQVRQVAQAQAPAAVPAGTTVRIDSSPSAASISQLLKQQFEAKFPDSKVELNQTDSTEALKALGEGKIDLVAIGRSLTPAEQAAGFVQEPVARRKIAVVVGDKNPFPGDMTGEQFAAIFRGEIVNWSEIGGSQKPIRVLDRLNSDTRGALQPYPVFQAGPFQTGSTAVPINDASTDAMISQLGDDGISYALVDQVANRPGVKIVSLYGTPPSDPSYPFSQQLSYVYKGPNPNPAVQSFLGFAKVSDAQPPVATAPAAPAAVPSPAPVVASPIPAAPAPAASAPAAPNPTASVPVSPSVSLTKPSMVAQAPMSDTEEKTGIPPWLWLLSLPLLGGLIWALLKGLGGSDDGEERVIRSGPVSTAAIAADRTGENSRIILTPRNAHEAYAYWEVPEAHKHRIRKEEGGQKLSLRLYDVTGLEFDRHPAHSIQEFECDELDQDLRFPIPQTNRDYLVELGYVTYQGRWVKLAQSNAVHIAADGTAGPVEPRSSAPAPTLPMFPSFSPSEPSFSPSENSFRDGMPLVDPANLSLDQPPVDVSSADLLETPEQSVFGEELSDFGLAGTVGAVGATGAAMAAANQKGRVKRSQITLSPLTAQDAYAEWEVLEHHKEIAKQHGGQNFILRICDVTGVDLEHQAPHSIQQFNCEESDTNRTVTVPDNGEYVAEIGYLAKNGRWLRIARSAPVHIPIVNSPSETSYS